MRPGTMIEPFRTRGGLAVLIASTVAALALGVGGTYVASKTLWTSSGTAARPSGDADHAAGEHSDGAGRDGHIVLPQQKWRSAGLDIQTVRAGTFQQKVAVTGKLTVNEDRTAHIYPLVAGRIHKVNVRFGQDVKKGKELALVDSREVGDAKLLLYRNRLETRIAKVHYEWTKTINDNTQALIAALKKGTSLETIESMFPDRPMGTNREKLLSAYADLHKAKADFQRLRPLTEKGITSGAELIAAKATYEAARAKYQAWLEQLKHTGWHDTFEAQQTLHRAQSGVDVSLSKLRILGYTPDQLQDIDPGAEGEAIAHYPVRAPFDGTIIRKDAALQERVGPDKLLFELADLSTLWLQADIYQKHLPYLQTLSGDTVRFRVPEYKADYEAKVFYRGEMLDPKTRTARLMALVENPDRRLKPGMFVEVALPAPAADNVIQVPRTAVVEEDGETYVFVYLGGDEFRRRDVEPGRRSDGLMEIVKGLKPGDKVVVSGTFALKTAAAGETSSTHSH